MSLFSTNTHKIYKKIGFYSDQSGIMRRYQREKDFWDEHLNKTKSFILKSAEGKGKNKCAVMGSGWLLDVPINELSEMFSEVYLLDIYHHTLVEKSIKHLKNVRLIEADLSGFAVKIYQLPLNFRKIEEKYIIENIKPHFDFYLDEFDFVISCNILNQLDILLLDYLKKKVKISDEIEKYLRTLIQDTHLKLLPAERSCIVTDVEELWLNKNDEIEKTTSLVYSNFFPVTIEDKWVWKFDNHFLYRNTHKTWFNVIANNI